MELTPEVEVILTQLPANDQDFARLCYPEKHLLQLEQRLVEQARQEVASAVNAETRALDIRS